MKFFHISDLHLGKRLLGESLLTDQEHMLNQILEEVDQEHPQAVLIAGDVYDKSVPSAEAVVLLDHFLEGLCRRKVEVFIIGGNHDSPERLEFAKNILKECRIHVAGTFQGKLDATVLEDSWGSVCVWQMPFVKPGSVRQYFEEALDTYDQAVRSVLATARLEGKSRHILLAHQYVVSQGEKPLASDSEQLTLGGLDEVDAACFDAFDYVALGHIHRPQKVKRMEVRYAGSPLKYSFSEVNHKKAITVVDMEEKGKVSVRKIPLLPLHDMAVLRGSMEELLGENNKKFREGYYVSVVLTDESPVENPIEKIRRYFPGMLEFAVENTRTRNRNEKQQDGDRILLRTPQELFGEFYLRQNHVEMSQTERDIMADVFLRAGEGTI